MEWPCEGGGEPEAVVADGLSLRYRGSVCVGIRLSGRIFAPNRVAPQEKQLLSRQRIKLLC